MRGNVVPLRANAWRGQTDATLFETGDGRLRRLLNCYVDGDGQQIIRFPGFRFAAVPNFETQFGDAVTHELEMFAYLGTGFGGAITVSDTVTISLKVPHRIPNGQQRFVVVLGSLVSEEGFTPDSYIPSVAGGLGQVGIDGIYQATFANNAALTGTTLTITAKAATNPSKVFAEANYQDTAGKLLIFEHDAGGPHVAAPDYRTFFAWAKLRIPHALVSLRDRLLVIGEVDYRRTYLIAAGEVLSLYTATTGAGPFISTLNVTLPGGSLASANYIPIQGEYVLLENVTGDGAAALNNRVLRVANNAVYTPGTPNTMVFQVEAASAIGGVTHVTTGRASAARNPNSDSYSLCAFTLLDRPDINTPLVGPARAAIVANTIRDWGGQFGQFHYEGYLGRTKRRVKQIPRRLSVDVAGNRVILAAPGYGVCFQVPCVVPVTDVGASGVNAHWNSGYDRPRSLGLPKAALHAVARTLLNSDQTLWTPNGAYKLRIAFKDDFTNDVGLASDEVTATVTGSATGNRIFIQLSYLHPGYLMSECNATSVNVYCSRAGGTVLGLVRNVKVPPFGTEPPFLTKGSTRVKALVRVNLFNFDPEDLARKEIDFFQAPPVIPQMPMGAKDSATIRGTTFFGGHYGDTGQRNELQSGELTASYDEQNTTSSKHQKRDEISFGLFDHLAAPVDRPFNMASAGIPPAYAGVEMFSQEAFVDDPGSPNWHTQAVGAYGRTLPPSRVLEKLFTAIGLRNLNHGPVTLASGTEWPETWWPRWGIEGYRFSRDQTYAKASAEAFMVLPRGHVWYSEQGRPGETPSVNRIILDADQDEDVESIGRWRNHAVICTRNQTHAIAWGSSVRGASPVLMSSVFGNIAPNTMAEFPGGVGWVSDRGPVALTGSVQWIGDDIPGSFIGLSPRYQRDEQGMMLHAWSCHDPERELLYFGMRSGRLPYTLTDQGPNGTFVEVTWDTASEDQKTKFPCDEVLIWSYRQGAWSTWQPRMNIHWMHRVLCADGIHRICFLGDDLRIYALEDGAQDSNFEPVRAEAGTAGLASTTFAVVDGSGNPLPWANLTAGSGKYSNNSFVAEGMKFCIYDPETDSLKGTGTIAATPADNATSVTLSTPCTWAAGDVILIGLLDMDVQSNSLNLGEFEHPKKIEAVIARYSLYSRLASEASESVDEFASDDPPLGWAAVSLDSERAEGINLTRGGYMPLVDKKTELALSGKPLVQQWNRGTLHGHELQVRFQALGGQQVRLSNLLLEMGPAAK